MDKVSIGKIIRPHGLNGFVIVRAFADEPRNLKPGIKVLIDPEDSEFSQLTIREVLHHKYEYRVSFQEISSRTQAEKLVNKHIRILKESLEALPDNEYYMFELIGYEVRSNSGESLGRVEEIISNPGNDLLKVVYNNKKNFLVPMVKEIIQFIDTAKHEIIMNTIDGLIE